MTDYDEAAAVQRGFTLLAHVRPEFYRPVDLGRLDISNAFACMLRETFGSYFGILPDLKVIAGFDGSDTAFAVEYGFCAPVGDSPEEYDEMSEALTREWVRRITEVRNA